MESINVVELVTGQKLLANVVKEDDKFTFLKKSMWLSQGLNGSMSLVPYTALGKVDVEIKISHEKIITSYELDDKNLKTSYAGAWEQYRMKKTGIITQDKKLDLI